MEQLTEVLLPPIPPSALADTTERPARRLLGLSGYPGVGKDTVAKMLGPLQYKRLAFADPIRALAYDMDPAVHDQVDVHGWDAVKAEDGYVRRYLQKLGQKVREHVHPDVWLDAVFLEIQAEGRYVITDVRYLNEAHAVAIHGGKLVRVERPGHGPVNDHSSEVEMDGHQYDYVLVNDGDLNSLFDKVMSMEEELWPGATP